ncbi:MAG: cyclic nucleotide-binding domain-containing protein [Deltaproteobacteria bacterium]
MRSSKTRPLAPMHALHHALDALAAGDGETALRHAIPALADTDAQGSAADIVGRALALLGEDLAAVSALKRAVPWLVLQGHAPHAVACAITLGELVGGNETMHSVASAFSADAPTGGEAAPPSLKHVDIAPLDAKRTRKQLISAAKKALAAMQEPTGATARTRMPLWTALPHDAFERFAAGMHVRVLAPGAALMTEGEPGLGAFVVARGEVRVTRGTGEDEVELAVLGVGAIVGEMALVTDAPRAATVTATRGTLVLESSRDALNAAAQEVPAIGEQVLAFCHKRLVDNVLRTAALLREIPPSEREGLAALFETRTYEPGEALINEGDSASGLHLLAAGSVEVCRADPDGEVLRIAALGPGSCVGEISLVMRRPATASVIAATPTVSLVLAAEKFMAIVKSRPTLFARLYELAVEREDETLSVLGQEAEDADDLVMV